MGNEEADLKARIAILQGENQGLRRDYMSMRSERDALKVLLEGVWRQMEEEKNGG